MNDRSEGPMVEALDVVHRYGPVTALDGVSLRAERGEFLTILGSSGSGKTTMLRVISGLEMPQSATRLAIDGVDVSALPAAQRNCTTVFQSYALFPHMSVIENVAYGLRIRQVPRAEAAAQAMQALDMVQLGGKADRRIAQLSGGERQRVALARAVVTRPAVLLLDEPLGALDEKLRQDMQLELVALQKTLGMTFINITHSQEEALTMSDRVVLMRHGRVVQTGAPLDLFDRPNSHFAAEFMGYENILAGTFLGREGAFGVVELPGGTRALGTLGAAGLTPGDPVALAVRAERLSALPPEGIANRLQAQMQQRIYRGKYVDLAVVTTAGPMKLRRWEAMPEAAGLTEIGWRSEDAVILAPASS